MDDTSALLALLKDADGILFPAADSGALVGLLQRARRDLQIDPPDAYMAFLRRSDGAVADGLMLYGSRWQSIDQVDLPELVAINISRRAYRRDPPGRLQLGEIDDDLIVFDSADGSYARIDRPSGDCQAKAVSLHELVEHLIG